MNDLRILLDDNELDIKGNTAFPLNYSVSDVKDPSKRNSDYSKTLILVGSKNNNRVLGGLFDINADFTFFNPNFKTECTVVQNGTEILKGYLRLTKIVLETENYIEGDLIEYEVLITGITSDFFTSIKNKKLNELDFSRNNHVLNHENIVNSWNNTAKDVFTYPILYKDSKEYQIEDFKPAIFKKAYLKRMAIESGFELGGALMDETTSEGLAFSKEVVPFNGINPTLPSDEIERRKFKVRGGNVMDNADIYVANPSSPWSGFNNTPVQIKHIDETSAGLFDNGNLHYDGVTNNGFTSDSNGYQSLSVDTVVSATFNAGVSVNLEQFSWGGQAFFGWSAARGSADTSFRFAVGIYINGVLEGEVEGNDLEMPSSISSGSPIVLTDNVNINLPSVYLRVGDYVTVKSRVISATHTSNLFVQYSQHNLEAFPQHVYVTMECTTSDFYNGLTTGQVSDGDNVVLSEFIPANINQSDILTDIIKCYNAYISVDPLNEKLLIIETRDGYYDRGMSVDWTNKKDHSVKDEIVLLSELQNKKVLFTHAKGSDDFNKNYSDSLGGEVFGQHEIAFNNEFVSGTKQVTTPFASTPMIYSDSSKAMIVPSINVDTPEMTPRTLNYGGLIPCATGTNWNFTYMNGSNVKTTTIYNSYPYAGHYDNPIAPSYSINFGELPYHYTKSRINNTKSTLYNRFWKNYIEQINEGRKITMSFNLNEVDISFIKNNLNTRIFERDAWYFINKIIDYDASNDNVTKVELLKVKESIKFVHNPKDIDKGTDVDNDGGGHTHTGTTGATGEGFFDGDSGLWTGEHDGVYYENSTPSLRSNYFSFTELKALESSGSLIQGLSYFCHTTGTYFIAINNSMLDMNTIKKQRVIKSVNYTVLGVWNSLNAYSVGDRAIWGGVIWERHAMQSNTNVDYYNLAAESWKVDLTEDYYEYITLNIKVSESGEVDEASDNRGNIVRNPNDYQLMFSSDWGDARISNNISAGFINNSCDTIRGNNIGGSIYNNYINGSILNNSNAWSIRHNFSNTGVAMIILNNSNNGHIQYLNAVCTAIVGADNHNGDIGVANVITTVGNCESGDGGATDKTN